MSDRTVSRFLESHVAQVWAGVLDGFIGSGVHRGKRTLGFEDFGKLAKSLQGILIGRHGPDLAPRKCGSYNSMDAMRAILAVLESLGMAPVVYGHDMHVWFQKRQGGKYRDRSPWTWTASDIQGMVIRLRCHFRNAFTVSFSSIQVLICEARQAVNSYGIRGVCCLIRRYKASSAVRAQVAQLRIELMQKSGVGQCHTVTVLECIRRAAGMTVAAVVKASGVLVCSRQQLVFMLGSLRLCPKVCLEAIPEWESLRRCMALCLVRAQRRPPYLDVARACQQLGVRTHASGGRKRLQKAALVRLLMSSMKQKCSLKRSYKELATAVREAGGMPVYRDRVKGRSVRRRMSIADMEAFLAA